MTPAPVGVSLQDLLAAKERRAARQDQWLTQLRQPIISLTLVTPGAVKDNIRYRNCMSVALQACDQVLWQHHWPVLRREVFWLPTGAEALWCVSHPAVELKATLVDLEQTHPLGRLWDFDVFSPDQGQIGRRSLDLNRRLCLMCDDPAHVCARSRRHPVDALVARVEGLINGWFSRD